MMEMYLTNLTSGFYHCFSAYISVQNTSSAVEIDSLSCWFQNHPVIIVVQQRQ